MDSNSDLLIENKALTILTGFTAGIICTYLLNKFFNSPKEEVVEKEEKKEKQEKKVKFNQDVENQENLKDIINATIKETLERVSEVNYQANKTKSPSVVMHEPIKRRRYSENDEPIYKFCFTGGPCAGKTTAMTSLFASLQNIGFRPFLVPEAATTLMKAGFLIDNTNFTKLTEIQFQSCLMRYQIFIEDLIVEYASITSDKPVVIFCDRGLIDGKAYVSEQVWQSILDEMSWNDVYLRDSRYDAVIHMVTAADGAEKHYDLETNKARYETLEMACKVDK